MAAEPLSSQPAVPGRRAFFSRMLGEAVAVADDVRGVPHYRLWELPDDPPEKIAKLVPVVRGSVRISLDGDHVCAATAADGEPVPLFAATDENTFVFNRFTGEKSLADVAVELAAAAGWPAQEAFDHTRQLFLRLVNARICVPDNDPE